MALSVGAYADQAAGSTEGARQAEEAARFNSGAVELLRNMMKALFDELGKEPEAVNVAWLREAAIALNWAAPQFQKIVVQQAEKVRAISTLSPQEKARYEDHLGNRVTSLIGLQWAAIHLQDSLSWLGVDHRVTLHGAKDAFMKELQRALQVSVASGQRPLAEQIQDGLAHRFGQLSIT